MLLFNGEACEFVGWEPYQRKSDGVMTELAIWRVTVRGETFEGKLGKSKPWNLPDATFEQSYTDHNGQRWKRRLSPAFREVSEYPVLSPAQRAEYEAKRIHLRTLAIGQAVSHPTWGKGRIVEIGECEGEVLVRFNSGIPKLVSASFLNTEPSPAAPESLGRVDGFDQDEAADECEE